MGDHFTTQYNHRQRVLMQVHDVFWWVRQARKCHREMLDMLNEQVYAKNSWKRLTQNRQSYIRGVIDMELRFIDRNEIEWCVYHKDHGHLRKADHAVLKGKWHEVEGELGTHFWKGTTDIWSAEPEVFTMYNQNPEHGYRIKEVTRD